MMEHSDSETDPLFDGVLKGVLSYTVSVNSFATSGTPRVKVYKRRWYILMVFALMVITMTISWNFWTPISGPAEAVFGWSDAQVAMFNNYGCVAAFFTACFISWLVVSRGLRLAMLVTVLSIFVGAGLRCLGPEYMTVTASVGSVLSGLASLSPGGAVVVSSVWFPAEERITATSVGNAAYFIGIALSFVIGPNTVNDPLLNETRTWTNEDSDTAEDQIMLLVYSVAALSLLLLLFVLIYFPAKPPMSPCPSAQTERMDFKTAIFSLAMNSDYWKVLTPYILMMGVYTSWSSMIDVNLKFIGIPQTEAGWIGFWCVIASAIGAFTIARVNDLMKRQIKTCLVILTLTVAVPFTWFALMVDGILEPSITFFYISAILAALLMGGCSPLYFELLCENAYPAPEAAASGVQMTFVNGVSAGFYFVFLIPDIGTRWMNWAQVGVIVPALLFFSVLKPKYKRLNLDCSTSDKTCNGSDA